MESLYRKYRPQTFDDVVGQRHVVETLTRAVEEGRMSHAYLFCGPRGTGKTTMARLLAKALLCRQGAGHLPDGSCEECRLVAEGAHPDVFELDAASRTGVDNVREEIINRVGYAAVRGAYKVYVIDEVHMLTTQSFNALLKTLEEPPSHVVFVLCTTDPQKIPATILSRVQRFEFHAISAADIEARLGVVCDREGFDAEPEALALIARHARGGLRDALSTLEQLSVFGSGAITAAGAQDMLGEVASSTLGDVTQALARRDVATLFSEVAALVDAGRDLLRFVRELSAHLRDVYVCAAVGPDASLVSAGASSVDVLAGEAAQFGSADRVARALAVLSDAATEMRYAPDQRLVLEVALTRLARPESDVTLDSLAERLAELERRLSAAPVGQVPTAIPAVPAAPAKAAPAAAAVPAKPAAPVKSETPEPPASHRAAPEAAPKPQPSKPATPAAPKPAAPATHAPTPVTKPATSPTPVAPPAPRPATAPAETSAPAPAPTPSNPKLDALWEKAVMLTISEQPARGQLLSRASLVGDDGETLIISFPPGQSFAYSMLGRRDVLDLIEPLVSKVFGPRSIRCTKQGSPTNIGASPSRGIAPKEAKPDAPKKASQRKTAEMPPAKVVEAPPVKAAAETTSQLSPREKPAAQPATPFPMPWDPPEEVPKSRQEPQDVVVSYEEEAVPYEDDYVPIDAYFDVPSQQAPIDAPAQTADIPTPVHQSGAEVVPPAPSAPVPAPVPLETPARPPEPVPVPEPETNSEPESKPEPVSRPKKAAKPKEPVGPSKQDREIEAALALLTGVFGPGVNAERIASGEAETASSEGDGISPEADDWAEPADYLPEDGGFAEDSGLGAYAEENFED